MSQKLFNQIVGWLALLKGISVAYYWIAGIPVVVSSGPIAAWLMVAVIVISLLYAYWAFTVKRKGQKLFDQVFGVMCGIGALVFFYYLFSNAKIMLGNWVFPTWLLLVAMAIVLYLFYVSFKLAKKAK
jgi:divalent metal cation (Fe/Co/Zn/Cd) transporter